MTSSRIAFTLLVLAGLAGPARAQRELTGTARMKQALDKLNVLGCALMIGAHPDDENTALLAYLARGRKLRTAYLSLTRGEGGQNLIGPEQGELLGLLRTQELLAARRIDGAEQYFTRAIDFGYSKSAEETIRKWGREDVLGDMVWVIRKLRPDVIISRFSGTADDGHGHHQSAALLSKAAFTAAADPSRFPEQLRWVQPWQARRVFWNVFSFKGGRFSEGGEMPGRLDIDVGEYDPVLGYSYAEIAGMSRSMHRSQGFGAPETKGPVWNSMVVVAGEPAPRDMLDDVDTSWGRVPKAKAAAEVLVEAARTFQPEKPEGTVPLLIEARGLLANVDHYWAEWKREEIDEAIAQLTGLWLDAAAERALVVPGTRVKVEAVAINRSRSPLELESIEVEGAGKAAEIETLAYNQPVRHTLEWDVPEAEPFSQPYWLRRPVVGAHYDVEDPRRIGQPDVDPARFARFTLRAQGTRLTFTRPVVYRYVDRVRGELTRPVAVVPAAGVAISESAVLFPSETSRGLHVEVKASQGDVTGIVRLVVPEGWEVAPQTRPFQLPAIGEQVILPFEVTPPAGEGVAAVRAIATTGGREVSVGTKSIEYEHIPPQLVAPEAQVRVVRTMVRTLAKRVGYVMGAGDEVAKALEQLGCEVVLLDADDLTLGDLSVFDAIVTGVRAFNVRADLRANIQRLLSYVEGGGTLVVQYNVTERGPRLDPLSKIGPYPLRIGRGRVSVEDAPVMFLAPEHPLLTTPNAIRPADFEGWVQERGLYFAEEWDDRYVPLWESSDPGEKPLAGGTLYARHGKGVYIFTGLSWFRQLPAGVAGAYRIFANFLSAGRVIQ